MRSDRRRGRRTAFALACALVLAGTAPGAGAVSLELAPAQSRVDVDGTVDVALVASGLAPEGAPSLASAELTLRFDPARLALETVEPGALLGAPDAADALVGSSAEPDGARVALVSLRTPGALDAEQASEGVLARIRLRGTHEGSAPLVLADAALADAFGEPLPVLALDGVTLTVPEPSPAATAPWALGVLVALRAGLGRLRRAQRRRRPTAVGLAFACALLLAPARAALACPPRLEVLPDEPNGIELGLGATNANAAVGGGGLTATLSRCGELTSLKWPSPSYTDQLQYLSDNAVDARLRPHLGALETMGAFAGIAYEAAGQSGFSWLRDAEWTHTQRYTRSSSAVVLTESAHEALGLRVLAWTFVLPERDVLVSHFRVVREPLSPVQSARLLFYANPAPTSDRLELFPVADTGLDYLNDFAAVYDRDERAVLHFEPASQGLALVDPILTAPPAGAEALADAVQDLIAGLTEAGVYLAIGARGGDQGFQVGFDDSPLCAHQSAIGERAISSLGFPPEFESFARTFFLCEEVVTHPDGPLAGCREARGWTYAAESAFEDAADGVLEGSPIAACHTSSALARDLSFHGGVAEATFYVAAASSRDAAYALLDAARAEEASPGAQRAETEAWWADLLSPARLPDTEDAHVLRFARRALASLRTATDATSGAMVASVAAQPPYGLDWPRDGAFLNHALDLSGFPELVTAHNRFYVRVQRKGWRPWSIAFPQFQCPSRRRDRDYPACVPPGTFEMNYYADPDEILAGGPISFEIDTAGLAVWTLWDHAAFLEGAERSSYLEEVCPAIERGAANLATCRDEETGLPCAANEDDNLALTQDLQGAETVLLAIESAIAAAGDCGFAAEDVAAWEARAAELREAILAHFVAEEPAPHLEGPRRAWAIWPARLLPYGDPLMQSHAAFLGERSVEPVLDRSAATAGYNAENIVARAQLFRALGDAAGLEQARERVRLFVDALTTPDTHHMAEFAGRVDQDLDGDGETPDYLPQNDVPHVWQQSNLLVAALLAFGTREEPPPRTCDADGDGVVTTGDVAAIFDARGALASGLLDPRDADEDGRIGAADARLCALRCAAPGCLAEAE